MSAVPLVSGDENSEGSARLARQNPSLPCNLARLAAMVCNMAEYVARRGSAAGNVWSTWAIAATTQPLPRDQKIGCPFASLTPTNVQSRYHRPRDESKRPDWDAVLPAQRELVAPSSRVHA